MGNIFEHDAVSTWSGFTYQGRIAVYLAVKKIYELSVSGEKAEIKKYLVEMEKCEDIAFLYKDGGNEQYLSIHQVKNQADKSMAKYKNPLTQLMLEKGFYIKHKLGNPQAFLHVSNQIDIKDGKTISEIIEQWKKDILGFYAELRCLQGDLHSGINTQITLEEIVKCLSENKIDINRKEYTKLLKETKEKCNKQETVEAEKKLNQLLDFMENKFCVLDINGAVDIYKYEDGTDYCSGTDVFSKINDYVKKYKGNVGNLCEEQYAYITDRLLCFVQDKILERHKLMQENKKALCAIPLEEFEKLLDASVEKYEEEANILALKRMYDDLVEQYCNSCAEEGDCQGEQCRLQQSEYKINTLERNNFIKACYNLSPECYEKITDRACLGKLLKEDGMLESVFPSIKNISTEKIVQKEDKIHFKIMNKDKIAFITAISGKKGSLVVGNIVKAMKTNQDLIETIFDADQLVTSRLNEASSIWDNSCIAIRPSDLEDSVAYDEHSICVAKKPEFIDAEQFIKNMEK